MTSGAKRRAVAAGMAVRLFVGQHEVGARLQQITIPGEGGVTYGQYQAGVPGQVSLPGGAVKTFGYDPLLGMTSNRVVDGSGNVVLNRGYQRSRTGTIQAMNTEQGQYAYAYDAIDQLIQVQDPVLADQSFSYDAAGNRVTSGLVPKPGAGSPEQKVYIVNALNQYLSITSVTSVVQLSYDLNGNLTQEVANGVIYGFRWDGENRLVGYSNSESGVSASYYYDPFGRRLRKVVNGVTNWYLYADEGLVEEMDGQGHEIRSYGYAPNSLWMNDPVYLRVATGQGTNVYYFLNDQLGAPQKLIARNGEVVWSMESEAFGKAAISATSTITNNLRFSSQYYDEESELHYNTHRYYESEVGRYITRDPVNDIGFIPITMAIGAGNVSLYREAIDRLPYGAHAYASFRNSLPNAVDPLGLGECSARVCAAWRHSPQGPACGRLGPGSALGQTLCMPDGSKCYCIADCKEIDPQILGCVAPHEEYHVRDPYMKCPDVGTPACSGGWIGIPRRYEPKPDNKPNQAQSECPAIRAGCHCLSGLPSGIPGLKERLDRCKDALAKCDTLLGPGW